MHFRAEGIRNANFNSFPSSEIYLERKIVSRNNDTSGKNKKKDLTWRFLRDPKDESRVRYELKLFSKSKPNHLSVPPAVYFSSDYCCGAKSVRGKPIAEDTVRRLNLSFSRIAIDFYYRRIYITEHSQNATTYLLKIIVATGFVGVVAREITG